MTIKFVEIKLCRTCKENLNYKKFRKVNSLKKGQNKGKFVGWTDINGGKRFSNCSECEKGRFYKSYRSNPIPQLIYNFKKRAKLAGVPFDLEPQDIKNKLNLANTMCPVLGVDRDMLKIISLL
tara:strand:- start:137 stop:505 length:369 start_codon:yes stop_codon:yes gene_type:complete